MLAILGELPLLTIIYDEVIGWGRYNLPRKTDKMIHQPQKIEVSTKNNKIDRG